jgi:phenylacetate-CoA ligase
VTLALRAFEPAVEAASREEIAAGQLASLQAFLAASAAASPFHVRRAAETGIDLTAVRSLDQFREIPLMRKEDVVADVAADPPFGSLLAVPPEELAHFVETSGTTSAGTERYALTRDDLAGLTRQEAVGFAWAGVSAGRVVATTFPMTTKAAGRWHALGVEAAGGLYLPIGSYDARRKLEYLGRLSAHMLIATPSYLRRLEIEAGAAGISLRDIGIEALMISAEPFSVEWALERQEVWGATVYEQYGSTQRAFAWSCEGGAVPGGRRGGLHTLPHLAVYEVVDPESGEHVDEGEVGELVVTPFASSSAMPLVRFASGDRVRYLGHGACSCGRAFASIESGHVHRYDDRLKVKGVNLDPDTLDALIAVEGVRDYEGVVATDDIGRETLTVHVEPRDGHEASVDTAAIAAALREETGLGFRVILTDRPLAAAEIAGDIKKRRRWRDLRQN